MKQILYKSDNRGYAKHEWLETLLNSRDAIGLYETEQVSIQAKGQAKFLIIEVPMQH